MDVRRPLAIVTPTLDGDVLSRLARADASFTPGQLQRLIPDASIEGIRRVLKRLAGQGIVLATRVGDTAVAYSLNREHLGSGAVIELAEMVEELSRRITEQINAWRHRPVYAAIFGSWARGEATTTSDVDLFLIRPREAPDDEWDEQIGELERAVWKWTGNDARAFVIDEDRLPEMASEPVLADIASEGVTVHGTPQWLRTTMRQQRVAR